MTSPSHQRCQFFCRFNSFGVLRQRAPRPRCFCQRQPLAMVRCGENSLDKLPILTGSCTASINTFSNIRLARATLRTLLALFGGKCIGVVMFAALALARDFDSIERERAIHVFRDALANAVAVDRCNDSAASFIFVRKHGAVNTLPRCGHTTVRSRHLHTIDGDEDGFRRRPWVSCWSHTSLTRWHKRKRSLFLSSVLMYATRLKQTERPKEYVA